MAVVLVVTVEMVVMAPHPSQMAVTVARAVAGVTVDSVPVVAKAVQAAKQVPTETPQAVIRATVVTPVLRPVTVPLGMACSAVVAMA